MYTLLLIGGILFLGACQQQLEMRLRRRVPPPSKMQIYLMLGQSNMVGQASLEPEARDPHVLMFAADGKWKTAYEPTHDSAGAVDFIYAGQTANFSCGLTFGKTLRSFVPEIKVGLVPCARNGTSIIEWMPSASPHTYYGVTIKRAKEAAAAGEIAGVIFHQGETDALPRDRRSSPEIWRQEFETIVRSLRADLGIPSLPVVFAQLGRTTRSDATDWELMKRIQASVSIPGVTMIRTEDFPLQPDGIHLSAAGQRMLGQRFASAIAGHMGWWITK